MPSELRLRQAELSRRAGAFQATLAGWSPPPVPGRAAIMDAVVEGLRDRVLRDPATWRPRMRSRDDARLALDAARHAFAAYPVPSHLERVWLGCDRLDPAETALRRSWYLCVASGGSLHRECTGAFLTKRETHRFLHPPVPLGFREALWYAVARSHTDDHGAALRLALSKAARPAVTPFWKDAARFLVNSGLARPAMDDVVDFLSGRCEADPAWSLRGRTVGSVTALMHAWHRETARRARVEGGRWAGFDVDGYARVEEDGGAGPAVAWTIVQILTGDDLADEGSAQRHCVAGYKGACVRGACSIWSLRRDLGRGPVRVLTLEVDRDGVVVQARGRANRVPVASEMAHVRRWADAAGLSVSPGAG